VSLPIRVRHSGTLPEIRLGDAVLGGARPLWHLCDAQQPAVVERAQVTIRDQVIAKPSRRAIPVVAADRLG
jgi:hypothetical protein